MSGWDELLGRLAEGPRENGTAALHQTAAWLHDGLSAAGVEVELAAFTATPWVLRLAGVLILVGGILYFRAMRAGRRRVAFGVAVATPVLLLAQLELQLPVFGWVGAETQHHVIARVPANAEPLRRLVFAAHYDTKTDLLDHVERAPVDFLAAPLVLLMLLGAPAAAAASRVRRGGRALALCGRIAAWGALLYGVLGFAALSAGAFVPARSPGALDDGASCALLVRLAETLADAPLERTEVELWWLSAEEVGVQGSALYARQRFAHPPALETSVVNLEGLGASRVHGVIPSERSTLRSFAPDPLLVALLDRVHREQFGQGLASLPVGGATDARSFMAQGLPAATLFSREPGQLFTRGLHSARDDRSRLDVSALDASLAFLLEVAGAVDAGGLDAR